jgi:hypothetical protein
MKIAKIVGSNSHVDYIARVIDDLDSSEPPGAEDFGFSTFVSIPLEKQARIIGVIYNSMLMNPDYANYGPRLSPKPDLGNFSPDFIDEQGCLIGILLLGSIDDKGEITQGVPNRVIPAGQDVLRSDEDTIKRFHSDEGGNIRIHYYSQVTSHAGNFAAPLLESIIERLSESCSDEDEKRLGVLKRNLTWQRTIGGMRL